MLLTNPIFIVSAAALLVGAWYADRNSWRRKSRAELLRMAQADDWRYHRAAINELRSRGEDVSIYIPRIVAKLISDSAIERAAAQIVLKDCFPDLAAEIYGFSPTAGVEACRAKASPLLARFRVS